MNVQVKDGFRALTEKEKLTLRMIVRGHDAKSIARSLDLSVHTINERLRDARRKMAVSSSREAARLLLEAEGGETGSPTPEYLGHKEFREDAATPRVDQKAAPIGGAGRATRRPMYIIGGLLMTFALGLLAFAALSQVSSTLPPTPAAAQEAPNAEVVDTARQFLALLDESRWDESYRATGEAFRKLNTAKVWADASEQGRAPLGAAVSRTFVSQENLPAPPNGYLVVKFRTIFANKAEPTVETVSLEREDGSWRVVAVIIG